MVSHSTTIEEHRRIWLVVSASHTMTQRISWRDHISNEEVYRRTDQPPLTHIIHTTRLKFFGHTARADPFMDHSRALRSSAAHLPMDWNRRSGRPRQTWLCAVDSDVADPLNIGYHLSPSTKSTDMEGACRNGNVHWTSHMIMNSW